MQDPPGLQQAPPGQLPAWHATPAPANVLVAAHANDATNVHAPLIVQHEPGCGQEIDAQGVLLPW